MNLIAIIDVFSVIFFAASFGILLTLNNCKISKHSRIFLCLAFLIYLFVQISNVLEHGAITDYFDRYEDYLELLFIPLFISFLIDDHNWLEALKLKRTGIKLRQSEKRFRDMTEKSSDWLWEIDENNFYIYSSPKVTYLLGYETDEIIGKTPFDLMPEQEKETVASMFAQIKEKRKDFNNLENINIHKNGSLITLETSGIPIFDNDGVFKGYRGIDRDITSRKKAELEKEKLIKKLQISLDEIETLRDILPVCSYCKSIRDDKGYWNQIELYFTKHSQVKFSHGICPDCLKKNFPKQYQRMGEKGGCHSDQ